MSKAWIYCKECKEFCCCDSTNSTCNSAILVHSSTQGPELVDASKRINQILDEVRAYNQDPNRELALLGIPKEQSDGTVLLLEWVTPGLSVDSNVDEIKNLLL